MDKCMLVIILSNAFSFRLSWWVHKCPLEKDHSMNKVDSLGIQRFCSGHQNLQKGKELNENKIQQAKKLVENLLE